MQVKAITLVLVLVLAALMFSNAALDSGWPNWRSRKIAHILGGVCYIVMVASLTAQIALALSALVTGGLMLLRWKAPKLLRGMGGSARPHAYAELTYPLATTLAVAIGWLWLGNKWLALLPILYVAFGDAATGLVRSFFRQKEQKAWEGSIAMAVICLPLGLLYGYSGRYGYSWHLAGIGVAGAVVAVFVEKSAPLAKGWIDDNPLIVGSSLGVMMLASLFVTSTL